MIAIYQKHMKYCALYMIHEHICNNKIIIMIQRKQDVEHKIHQDIAEEYLVS